MPSRTATLKSKLCDAVASSAETHALVVGSGLAEVLAPVVDTADSGPVLETFQGWLAELLHHHRQRLIAADREQLERRLDNRDPRQVRDEAAQALYGVLVRLRGLLGSLFTDGRGDRLLVIEGVTPSDPKVLFQQADHARERLLAPDADLTTGEGATLDREFWVGLLETRTVALEEALEEVDRDRREEELSLVLRNRVTAEFDLTLGSCARLLEALYELGRFPELAERVRPAAVRRSSTAEQVAGLVAGQQDGEPQGVEPEAPEGTAEGPASEGAAGEAPAA